MIIGITGKSGSGKTTLANTICKTNQYYHINVDEIAHELLNRKCVQDCIKEELGINVSSSNRKELAEIVFTDRKRMIRTNKLLWELIRTRILVLINNYENVVIDWILLYHTEFFNKCDIKILVKCDNEKRLKSAMIRDNISEFDINLRDQASIDYNESDFTYVIERK